MPRPASAQPTDVELQILVVLWERGPSTVRQVHEALSAARETGYSTTLKMMQVMKAKRLVVRDDSVRPQVYRAARSREQTQVGILDDLVQKAFGGSARRLVMRMVSANRISPDELAEVQRLITEAEKVERERAGREGGDS
jgi:BlaI family penicillinase repressor